MKSLILFICIALISCGHSSQNDKPFGPSTSEKTPKPIPKWKTYTLEDLPQKPQISFTSIDYKHYVRISTASQSRYYYIELDKITEVGKPTRVDEAESSGQIMTYAAQAADYIRQRYYQAVHRCRYSQYWRNLASIDIREDGPLLLKLEELLEIPIFGMLTIQIDQKNLAVLGLYNNNNSLLMNSSEYVSSSENVNQSEWLSRTTTFPIIFESFCQEAYDELILGPSRLPRNHIEAYLPNRELEVSRMVDEKLKRHKITPEREASTVHLSTLQAPLYELTREFSENEIETLIQIARSNKGVGL